ncbi:hypothetical protein L6164_016285 [Bauhinia variegata]|uniref:Uncharacterized protein n=1 Tax=Bauhinia variegata TaxID=167791 RepID=A0ACB9NPA4_BAUVA|nr:hypothetical protein L6164_016285 [Bauhinia variegata]
MGSLTEEQLLQMVRDFIESESESEPKSESLSTSNALSQDHKPRCLTLQEILRDVTDIEGDILQKTLKYAKSVESTESTSNLKRLVVMKLKMDGYEASLCKTSWVSSADLFPYGSEYEYIDVMTREMNGGKATRIIVDVDFRSQFELAKATTGYKELTDMLPSVFVGSEAKLNKIISMLCSAAKESLKEKGHHIPPWRKASYMQSKWLSEHCKKISIPANLE